MTKKRQNISYRQRAAIILAQLYRVAEAHREAGELLPTGPWLKVLANALSSAPARYDASRKSQASPDYFGLTVSTLTTAARRCGLVVTSEQIETQVEETLAWRARESKRIGRPHYAPMKADRIGELLGITDATRAAAKAWNLGTFGGSAVARKAARRERDRAYQSEKRREMGVVTRAEFVANSISKSRPWQAEGMSRTKWYELRRKSEIGEFRTGPSATNKSGQVRRGQVRRRQISDVRTGASATNIPIGLRPLELLANIPQSDPGEASVLGQASNTCRDDWIVRRGPKGLIVADILLPMPR